MISNDTKLYMLKDISYTAVKMLLKYRQVETVGQLLSLEESAIKSCPNMGAKRYESLIETLNKNGIDHSYSEVYNSKPLHKREIYADNDISRLPASSDIIRLLRSHNITNINVLDKMSVGDMMEAGLDEALILRIVKPLILWQRKKKCIGCGADIDVLHVRRSIILILKREGIYTVDDLSRMTSSEINGISGIGYSSRKEIIHALQDYLEEAGLLER